MYLNLNKMVTSSSIFTFSSDQGRVNAYLRSLCISEKSLWGSGWFVTTLGSWCYSAHVSLIFRDLTKHSLTTGKQASLLMCASHIYTAHTCLVIGNCKGWLELGSMLLFNRRAINLLKRDNTEEWDFGSWGVVDGGNVDRWGNSWKRRVF